MSDLQIQMTAISDLKPWARNARTHSKKQVRQIADSIQTFGFTNPVLVDDELTILAGHGRVAAAKSLGRSSVPCVRLSHMTPEQKRAYVLADNKLAMNAGWDDDILAGELEALLSMELDFDMDVIGFSISEFDSLIESQANEEDGDPDDDLIPAAEAPERCKDGDVWRLGSHRLVCGDALDPHNAALLMDGKTARMVFADPPYNVPIDGHVGGSGAIKHREFAMASGEMSESQFAAFLHRAFERDGSLLPLPPRAHLCL